MREGGREGGRQREEERQKECVIVNLVRRRKAFINIIFISLKVSNIIGRHRSNWQLEVFQHENIMFILYCDDRIIKQDLHLRMTTERKQTTNDN